MLAMGGPWVPLSSSVCLAESARDRLEQVAWEVVRDEAVDTIGNLGHGCKSGLLPILAVTSENYAPVFDFWQSSLDLIGYPVEKRHVHQLKLTPPFGYCTDSWRQAIDQQLADVVAWIEAHPGEHFLHTDTDIQFFPRFVEAQGEWLRWMFREGLDMIFMRERTEVVPHLRQGEVNAGFYLVHCNDRTLQFWKQVLARELQDPKMRGFPPYADQYHLNVALGYRPDAMFQMGDFGVRWGVISDNQCIWSQPSSDDELVHAAFHHAVNTADKPRLLRAVREKVLARQATVLQQLNRETVHRLVHDGQANERNSAIAEWEVVS